MSSIEARAAVTFVRYSCAELEHVVNEAARHALSSRRPLCRDDIVAARAAPPPGAWHAGTDFGVITKLGTEGSAREAQVVEMGRPDGGLFPDAKQTVWGLIQTNAVETQ